MDNKFELVIIGGGIVGLSAALEAVTRFPGLRVGILEKEAEIARHQTGHNSGVIHSGVYYRTGSLKANNCVAGAAQMIRFCREHAIRHEVCGKVIVATRECEVAGLHELKQRGERNGVPELALLGPEQLRELEPHCRGVAALHIPGAGIADYSAVARKFADLAVRGGAEILTGSEVRRITRTQEGIVLETSPGTVRAGRVINCAGLQSDRIMRLAGDDHGLRIIPFRGEYYKIVNGRESLVKNLIYPVPDPRFPFLGVHFTRHVGGFVEAGPNAVLALSREGYRKSDMHLRDAWEICSFPGFWRMAAKYWKSGAEEVYRSFSKAAFTRALQKLVPEIRNSDLTPAGAGVRAQAVDRNGRLLDDFSIISSKNMIHVCNVPSPAATASLVIGRQIIEMAVETLQLESTWRVRAIAR